MNKRSLLHDIRQLRILFFPKDKVRFLILIVLMLIGSVLEAVGVGVIPGFVAFLMKPSSLAKFSWLGSWTASLPETPSVSLMVWASLIMMSFVSAKSIFLAFIYYVQIRIVNGFRVRLSCRMFGTYQSAPYEWLLKRSSSELQRNIIVDTAQVITGVIMPILDLIMVVMMGLFIIVAMFISTSSITVLGAFIIGGGVILVVRLFRKKLDQTGIVIREESKSIIQSIQQGFGAIVDSRIMGAEEYLADSFSRSITLQAKMGIIRGSIMKSTPLAIEVVALAGLLTIFLIIAGRKSSFVDAIPVMSLLGVATIRLKQMASRVTGQINLLGSSRAYIPDLIADIRILDKLEKEHLDRVNRDTDIKFASFEKLVLHQVTYSYPNADVAAVNNISLELKRGESIAFVGSTGCGKSTLVNLILGLLASKSGTIKVNGVDIFSNLESWRNHLGYIPQTIFLLDDTIRANVAFGVPDDQIDEKQLKSALVSARLDEFVATLREGVNTIVGERGVLLSGGQRQRIGIARSLYFDPDVLVMDEATSALDNKTEAEVMKAIQNLKKDRTLIMVAHRLSTVENCDRLYLIEAGEIIAIGSYKDLIENSVVFRESAGKLNPNGDAINGSI